MIIYLITICISCMLAHLAEKNGCIDENEKIHFNKKYVFALIVFLCIISGFRYMNYYQSDEYNYRMMVDSMENKSILSCIDLRGEWIFQILYWTSANIFNNNQALILIAAIITNTSFILYFYKNSKSLSMVIFLYITSGAYFTSMNIIRQYLAAAIIIWCFDLAANKNIKGYTLLVIIASGIHQSAWLMLPLYFVLSKKRIDKSALMIIGATLVVFLNFQSVMTKILSSGTSYDSYLEDMFNKGYGVKLIRIIVWIIPYSLLMIRTKICENKLKIKSSILYAVLISMCVIIISYKYVFFARIDTYFSIIALCGVAQIPDLFEKKSKFYVNTLMIILFFIYGSYQMSISPTYHNIIFENISGVL